MLWKRQPEFWHFLDVWWIFLELTPGLSELWLSGEPYTRPQRHNDQVLLGIKYLNNKLISIIYLLE